MIDVGDHSRGRGGGREVRHEALQAIAAAIAEFALDERGVRPEVELAVKLRKQDSRDRLLQYLVATLSPPGANPGVWMRWLRGGEQPVTKSVLQGGDMPGKARSQKMQKSEDRLATIDRQIAVQEQGLTDLRARREQFEQIDCMIKQEAVSAHLIEMIAPIFAMGPAWTIMRAISAHISKAALDEELRLIGNPKRRAEREQAIREERRVETDLMLGVLDTWSNDIDFEYELRDAVMSVAREYAKKTAPNPPRSSRDLRSSTRGGEHVRAADAIMDGLTARDRREDDPAP